MSDLIQNLLFQLKSIVDLTGVDQLNKKIAETGVVSQKSGAQQVKSIADVKKELKSLQDSYEKASHPATRRDYADAIKSTKKELEGLQKIEQDGAGGLGEIAGSAKAAGAALLGVGASIAAGIAVAKEFADQAAEMAKEQNELVRIGGLYREQAAAVQLASKQVGLSFEQQLQIANKLNVAVTQGSEEQKAAFQSLKIDLDKIPPSGRNAAGIFDQLVKNTNGLGDAATRTNALTKILGDDLQVKFQQVAGKIDNARAKAKELGLIFDDEKQAQLAQYRESLAQATTEFEALGIKVGTVVAPAFTSFLEAAKGFDWAKLAYGFSNPIAGAANFGKTLGELWGAYERVNEQAAFDARVKAKQAQEAKNLKAIQDALTKSYNEQTQALQLQQQQINTRQGARLAGIKATSSDDELVIAQRKGDAIRELEKKFYLERGISQKDFEEGKLKIEQKAQDDLLKSQLSAAKRTAASDKKANDELVANAEERVRAIQIAHQKARFEGGVDQEGLKKLKSDLDQAYIALENAKTKATEQGASDRKAVSDLEEQQKQQSHQRELDRIVREEEAKKKAVDDTIKDNARKKSSDDLIYETKKQQLIQSGLDEKQAENELAYLKRNNLKSEIEGIDALIRAKSGDREAETEIFDLKRQRLALVAQVTAAEIQSSGQIVDAKKSEIEAEKEAQAARQAGLQNLAAAFSRFANLVNEARSLNEENISLGIAQLTKEIKDINGVWPAQITSALLYFRDQLYAAQQEAFKKSLELFDKQVADELARIEKEQEEGRKLWETYSTDLKNLESGIAETRDKSRQEQRKSDQKLREDTFAKEGELSQALIDLETKTNEQKQRAAETAARERIRLEQDTQAALARAANEAQFTALGNQASLLDEQVKLESDLKNAKTPEEKAALEKQLSELGERKKRQAEHDAQVLEAIRKGQSDAEIAALETDFKANEDYLRRKSEYEAAGNTKALVELERLNSERLRLISERDKLEKEAAELKASREKEDRERAAAEEESEYNRQQQAIRDRYAKEISDLEKRHADEKASRDKALKEAEIAHSKALDELEKRNAEAFAKMSKTAQDYYSKLAGGAPASGGSSGNGPAGTTAGDGGNSRTTPPANTPPPGQPAPSPAPAPAQSPTPKDKDKSSSNPGGLTATNPTQDQAAQALARDLENTLKQDTITASSLFLSQQTDQAATFIKDGIGGLQRNIAFYKKQKGQESLVKVFEDFIKRYTDLLQQIESGSFKPDTGKPKNTDTTVGPDKTAATDTPGVTGGKPKVKDTGVGPDKTAAAGPVTVSDGSKKKERDPLKAQQFRDRADSAKSPADAKKIYDEAKAARDSGEIDPDDFNSVKARLDYAAFQGGFINQFNTTAAGSGGGGAKSPAPGSPAPAPGAPALPALPSVPTGPPAKPPVNGINSPLVQIGEIKGDSREKISGIFNSALDQAGIQ